MIGGQGFVGARVVRQLLEDGHEVSCLEPRTRKGRLDAVSVEMIEGDVRDGELIASLLAKSRDDVVLPLQFIRHAEVVPDHGTSVVALRLPIVYGPGIRLGGGDVVATLHAAVHGRAATLTHEPAQRLCIANVDDVAATIAVVATGARPRLDVYEVGGVVTSYGHIASLTEALVEGAKVVVEPVPSDPDGELAYLVSNARLVDEFGVSHRPLEVGLQQYIDEERMVAA